jgi:predicted small integral membrane protein
VIEARVAKLVMVASLAAFALLVAFDNLTDYETNFAFVGHVLSMDGTPPEGALAYRRLSAPALWHAAYALIILGEGLTGLGFGIAAVGLMRQLRSAAARFNRAKRLVFVAAAIGFLVWFFGFMVVGGEWFQMWRSAVWNGQQAAFRFYLTILAVLIFVAQPDGELG